MTDLLLANPRGFCAGVERAIAIVLRALDKVGAPLYVRHEVVHNHFVCEELRQKGVIFVENLEDVPEGQTVVFSAHGVSPEVHRQASARQLKVFDATCPLVTKVHSEVKKFDATGRRVIMIGHAGHPEVEGTMGQVAQMQLISTPADVAQLTIEKNTPLAYVSQTTLSVDDTEQTIATLRQSFPDIVGTKKDDICYATQNRQDAVKKLAQQCDLILVVGSPSSSNSNRLCEVARKFGVESYLIEDATHLEEAWFANKTLVGITAGASAPETLVQEVIVAIAALIKREFHIAPQINELFGEPENVSFKLPKELQ